MTRDDPLIVLVHGAGHDSSVWDATRAAMRAATLAVDLPGRAGRPASLCDVTVADAAAAIVGDVAAAAPGPVLLVGHSVAGTVLPSVAAQLGERVLGMVFVAGIAVGQGEVPIARYLPERLEQVTEAFAALCAEHRGNAMERLDVKTASSIDSLNFSLQPMEWAGVGPEVPRTYVRCLRDPIQPRPMQDLFIAATGATEVIDIDTGHTPAIDNPTALAHILDTLA